jgi:hypothetical protein
MKDWPTQSGRIHQFGFERKRHGVHMCQKNECKRQKTSILSMQLQYELIADAYRQLDKTSLETAGFVIVLFFFRKKKKTAVRPAASGIAFCRSCWRMFSNEYSFY